MLMEKIRLIRKKMSLIRTKMSLIRKKMSLMTQVGPIVDTRLQKGYGWGQGWG